MAEMSTWTVWNGVKCERCKARPGQPCVTSTGNPAREVHSARVHTTLLKKGMVK